MTTNTIDRTCPHCGATMKMMEVPQETHWEEAYLFVCFNDDCSYYERGWEWMMTHHQSRSSYRHRVDPHTGKAGPLPVWSETAMKDRIIEDEEAWLKGFEK